jgi:hypothetical protein
MYVTRGCGVSDPTIRFIPIRSYESHSRPGRAGPANGDFDGARTDGGGGGGGGQLVLLRVRYIINT